MRILVLTHARETRVLEKTYLLGLVAEEWRRAGHRVDVIRGTRNHPPADIVVNHVDLTVLPAEYADFLASYPRAVNAKRSDISKRIVSSNLVGPEDSWTGPVIVKTNFNCQASSEAYLLGAVGPRDPWRFVPRALSFRLRHHLARRSSPFRRYPIYDTLHEVPSSIWSDPRFVVERFLPEREGDQFVLRRYHFFGDRQINFVARSTDPIARGATTFNPEELEPAPELREVRRRLRLDSARMDYGMVNGQAVVYDTNVAPGILSRSPRMLQIAHRLAPGIDSFL